MHHPIILGIETSCDETAASIVTRDEQGHAKILSSVVWSQTIQHAPYGGVVPELAARAHVEAIGDVVQRAFKDAALTPSLIHGIAATAGPGLIGGLVVGLVHGKAMAASLNIPFMAINHLEGHALTPRLTDHQPYPYLLLLISGGHTQILCVESLSVYHRLGSTLDDAVGEAFDKTAKLLGLGYPGGFEVERVALSGNAKRFTLPKPLAEDKTCNFSFAGLKSAVRMLAEKHQPIDSQTISDICACFQETVCEILTIRVRRAILEFRKRYPAIEVVPIAVAGGVAANNQISTTLRELAIQTNATLYAPPHALCGDNAAMIAYAGLERYENNMFNTLVETVHPRWPLDNFAPKLPFAGVKA